MKEKILSFIRNNTETITKIVMSVGGIILANSLKTLVYDAGAKTAMVSKNPTMSAIRSYAIRGGDMAFDSSKYEAAKKIQAIAMDHKDDAEAVAYAVYAIGDLASKMAFDSSKNNTLALTQSLIKKEEKE